MADKESTSEQAEAGASTGGRWLQLLGLLILIGVGVTLVEPTGVIRGTIRGEQFFAGRPTSVWIGRLQSSDPATQSNASKDLADGGKEAVAVVRAMLGERDAAIRGQAIQILGKIGADARDAGDGILQALQDGDSHVRRVAALALPKVDVAADVAVPGLTALCQKDPSVEVSRALSKYGPKASSALDPLMAIMEDESLPTDVRWNAIRTIGKIRAPAAPAIDRLIALLKHKEDTIREHAAEALGDIGPLSERSVDHLVALLTDSHTRVRRDAVRSLGQIGGRAKTKLAEIKKLTKDKKELVRKAAKDAIKALTGK